jgi:hypothetical protein
MATSRAKKEATEAIAIRLEQINTILADCAKIADQNNINFNWDSPDGRGLHFVPKTQVESSDWYDSGCSEYYGDYSASQGEWRNSSYGC